MKKPIEKFEMPPYVKFGDPIYLLADKVNEVIERVNPQPVTLETISDAWESVRDNKLPGEPVLKPGVRITKNGKYYMEGKGFIKKEDAFI